MEVHKVETPQGKLLRIGFVRTDQSEDLREEINKWLKENYPKMGFKEFFRRLEGFNRDLWTITMEGK